jgi:TM2 domain-containing membrane protein YozV
LPQQQSTKQNNTQTDQKYMKLLMENPNTGILKKAPAGFSWTTLFFSGFPALFRGDIKWFIIQVLLCWTGIAQIIFAFIYNKMYIEKLLEKGFKVKDVEGGTLEDASGKLGINLPKFETQK